MAKLSLHHGVCCWLTLSLIATSFPLLTKGSSVDAALSISPNPADINDIIHLRCEVLEPLKDELQELYWKLDGVDFWVVDRANAVDGGGPMQSMVVVPLVVNASSVDTHNFLYQDLYMHPPHSPGGFCKVWHIECYINPYAFIEGRSSVDLKVEVADMVFEKDGTPMEISADSSCGDNVIDVEPNKEYEMTCIMAGTGTNSTVSIGTTDVVGTSDVTTATSTSTYEDEKCTHLTSTTSFVSLPQPGDKAEVKCLAIWENEKRQITQCVTLRVPDPTKTTTAEPTTTPPLDSRTVKGGYNVIHITVALVISIIGVAVMI